MSKRMPLFDIVLAFLMNAWYVLCVASANGTSRAPSNISRFTSTLERFKWQIIWNEICKMTLLFQKQLWNQSFLLPYEDVFPPAGPFWRCHKFLGLSQWSSHPLAYGFSLIGILRCPPVDHSLRCCYCWPNCWMQCRSDQGSQGGPSNRRGEHWEWSPHFQECTEKLTHSDAP